MQAVYTIAWSVDSRLLCSGSKDSTLKGETFLFIQKERSLSGMLVSVWSIKDKKLKQELPGHADEVFALDWAPDGSRVASGGKDKIIKL